MNNLPDLIACPFCGGEADAGWFPGSHSISCQKCEYCLDVYKADIGLDDDADFTPDVEARILEFSVTRWNTRAAIRALAQEDGK